MGHIYFSLTHLIPNQYLFCYFLNSLNFKKWLAHPFKARLNFYLHINHLTQKDLSASL
jgi:hypothetical protein